MMPEQIPSAILDVAARQHRELLGLERQQQAAVLTRLEKVLSKLRAEINGQSLSYFRDNELRVLGVLANIAKAESFSELDALLRESIGAAYGLAPEHAANEINTWIEHHGGEPRPINLSAVAELETETLIERYESSLQTFGQAVADKVRASLSGGIIMRQDRNGIVDAVAEAINGERWRAARIVRTETINAYNAAHNRALFEARDSGQVPELRKSAIATFDARTDQDSYPVHGQVRDLEDEFVDGDGRRYLHPPGRPNDREKEIPWLDDLDPLLIEAPERREQLETEREEQRAADAAETDAYRGRVAAFERGWSTSSQSRESIKWKRAAADAFDLPGKVYTRHSTTIDDDEQAQAGEDVRRLYDETQASLREQGRRSVVLRRRVVDNEIVGTFEDWTTSEPDGEYFEDEVDARRILRIDDDGRAIIMNAIPARRFEREDFRIGFFDASEIDPEAERSGPFGILEDDGDASLYHIPTGRALVSGQYTRDDLRRLARDFEVAGHVDSLGELVGADERRRFERQVDDVVADYIDERRQRRRDERGVLAFEREDFEIGFFSASEFDDASERSGVWGLVEYAATEEEESGGALYHIPTGREVLRGSFNKRDLRRLASDLDVYVDDLGRLPDERAPDYGDFDDELRSVREYYERERVDGFPAARGVSRYVDVGGVDFPALNAGVQPNTPGRYSKRVVQVVEEGADGQMIVSEQKGYLRGNFFYYKSRSDFENPNFHDVNDWHIVHAKSGVHLHSGCAMPITDEGLEVGGWRLSKFKEIGERLERYFDEEGNVDPDSVEDWLSELEDLQASTAPGFSAREYLGDRYRRDDWMTSPISRRARARLVKSDLEYEDDDILDFLDNGPEIEDVEEAVSFDDVPF